MFCLVAVRLRHAGDHILLFVSFINEWQSNKQIVFSMLQPIFSVVLFSLNFWFADFLSFSDVKCPLGCDFVVIKRQVVKQAHTVEFHLREFHYSNGSIHKSNMNPCDTSIRGSTLSQSTFHNHCSPQLHKVSPVVKCQSAMAMVLGKGLSVLLCNFRTNLVADCLEGSFLHLEISSPLTIKISSWVVKKGLKPMSRL